MGEGKIIMTEKEVLIEINQHPREKKKSLFGPQKSNQKRINFSSQNLPNNGKDIKEL